MNYQFFDWECFNYNLWMLPGVGFLRGPDPRPLPTGRYVSVLGTAHSFGRFCRTAFPERLEELTGEACLDLSTSAVGPRYFLTKPKILEFANAGAACIIQAPSARSCGNSRYNNDHWGNNVFQLNGAGANSPFIHENSIYPAMFRDGRSEEAIGLLAESKAFWVHEMTALLEAIRVPKILLWFSSRTPEYEPDASSYERYCGDFPQLVDRAMFDAVAKLADETVEVSSRSGLPIRFTNRFTGEEGRCYFGNIYRTSHAYYPSDEMQHEAAERLAPAVRARLGAPTTPLAPSPHKAMVTVAKRQATRSVGDEFGLVKLIHAIQAYHWDRGAAGDIGLFGYVDLLLVRLLEASLSRSAERIVDCDQEHAAAALRLLVGGLPGVAKSITLGSLAAQASVDGAVIMLIGALGPGRDRTADLEDLAVHGFEPEVLVDNDLLLTQASRSGELRNWLSMVFRERADPQFIQRRIGFRGHALAVYDTRVPSACGIDHKA